jgi:hypothetical protein
MEVTLREIRELGEGMVLIDQTPSQIAATALANTAIKVCLNLPHRADINTAAAALLLSDDQKDFLGKLPVGTAMVKLQDKHFTPFLLRIPHVKVKKGSVTDADLPGVSAGPEPSPSVMEAFTPIPVAAKSEGENVLSNDNDERASALVGDVVAHPLDGVNARYRRLGVSTRKGHAAKDALVKQGLLEQHDITLPHGKQTLLALTERGRRHARTLGLEAPRRRHPVHDFWCEHAARHYRGLGYTVEREVHVPGNGNVDLCATREGQRLAVEIETGQSDIGENIRKVLRDGFTGLVIVAVTTEALRKAQELVERLSERDNKRVVLCAASDILKR